MACNCIETLDAKLAEHNSRVQVTFTFGGDGHVRARVPTEKLNPRSRSLMGVVATYCPFCGTRYVEDAA